MTDEKKTDAWMPFWIGAYLADTMAFTTEQHGAYLLLILAYWRERAPLPDDDEALRGITKLDRGDWKRVRPVLARKFRVADGVWWHKRIEQEIAAADARAKKASEKASKAAQARWQAPSEQCSKHAPSMPQALPEHVLEDCPTPLPTSLSSPSGQKEKPARKRAAAPQLVSVEQMVAEGVDPQNAADWLVARKAKNLPLTPTVWQQTKDEAAKAGMTAAEAIKHAAGEGWAGFKAKWLQAEGQASKAPARAPTRHAGFETKDYREGITADGHLT